MQNHLQNVAKCFPLQNKTFANSALEPSTSRGSKTFLQIC